jgi:hypothetical protein
MWIIAETLEKKHIKWQKKHDAGTFPAFAEHELTFSFE